MTHAVNLHDATGIIVTSPGEGIAMLRGTTKPTDGDAGYAPGCIFIKTDGGVGTMLYGNVGTKASCDFDALA